MTRLLARAAVVAAIASMVTAAAAAVLAPEVERALASSAYVYIATERKGGGWSSPAEIWFMWDEGAVFVASPPTTWRAKRMRAGRTGAQIAVGSKDGPTFPAKGSFVRDPAVYEKLFATYARKYPDGWPKYETRFREGLKDGSRVLMRYVPVATASAPAPPSPTARP